MLAVHTIAAVLAALVALSIAAPALASDEPVTRTVVDVWPGIAPGETTAETGRHDIDANSHIDRVSDVTRPQLHLFLPGGHRARPTILVCPGGGYSILAFDLEGTEIATWINGLGYNAAVLTYRVPNKREGAFQDVERAMSLLRSHAKEWKIDARHLGVLGFSAGGHLAARVTCGYTERAYAAVDSADKLSCRPDFTLLIYPAYLMGENGASPPVEVTPHTGIPPIFLTQSNDDGVRCADGYAAALTAAGLPNKCVMYDRGGHGYGLRAAPDVPVHAWPEAAAAWLREVLNPDR